MLRQPARPARLLWVQWSRCSSLLARWEQARQVYVARVATLNTILDRAQLENFTITNENRQLTDVAHELLVKAGWISN